tara:strand:+ start:2742 stop:4985 length:2244 start_codon:yes stop_codon:yes gene_type:complete
MPLSNDTKIAKSFRALINKEYSTLQKKFFEEFGANTINISLDEIWSSAIDLTASNAEAAGIVKKYTDFELAPLQGFNQSGKPLAYYFASGSGFTPGTQINRIQVDPNLLQRNFVSDKYGKDYKAILRQNDAQGTQVPDSDDINWLFDYQTGILSVQNPNSEHQTPYKITVYQYTGEFGVGNISNTGSLITASAALNVLTFEKGNGDEFTVTIDTGSGGSGIFEQTGSFFATTNDLQITGSLITTGSVNLALDTSSTAVDKVMMYDNVTGQVFITSSAAIGGSSVTFFGTASGKESNPDPPQTIQSISTREINDPETNVQWDPITGDLKFIFGTPPNPSVAITELVTGGFKFEANRFNLQKQTFKVRGDYNPQLNTFQSASLSEEIPNQQVLIEIDTNPTPPTLDKEFIGVVGDNGDPGMNIFPQTVWKFKMEMETLDFFNGNLITTTTTPLSLRLNKLNPSIPTNTFDTSQISQFGGSTKPNSLEPFSTSTPIVNNIKNGKIEVGATGSIAYTASKGNNDENYRFINLTDISPTSVPMNPVGNGFEGISGSVDLSFRDDDATISFRSQANYDSDNGLGATPTTPGAALNSPKVERNMPSSQKNFTRLRSVRAGAFQVLNTQSILNNPKDLENFCRLGVIQYTNSALGKTGGEDSFIINLGNENPLQTGPFTISNPPGLGGNLDWYHILMHKEVNGRPQGYGVTNGGTLVTDAYTITSKDGYTIYISNNKQASTPSNNIDGIIYTFVT